MIKFGYVTDCVWLLNNRAPKNIDLGPKNIDLNQNECFTSIPSFLLLSPIPENINSRTQIF